MFFMGLELAPKITQGGGTWLVGCVLVLLCCIDLSMKIQGIRLIQLLF
jgi:hypothetical protein